MKELVISQPSKRELIILNKLQRRVGTFITDDILDKLYYEFFVKGTYTGCILTINNNIVGIGMTKRERVDNPNTEVAEDVSFAKAVRDYLVDVRPKVRRITYRYKILE